MKRYGLIGHPLGHSASANYFDAKFRAEGFDDCRYNLYDLRQIDDLHHLLVSEPALCGFNVTIPYKEQILPYLDSLSPEAERIGAVNCVRREGNQLIGFNTDADGVREALNELLQDEHPTAALILGNGGAARAVRYILDEREIPHKSVSRDARRGDLTYEQLTPRMLADYPLIVQATPVGMWPHTEEAPAIPYEGITPQHRLFDLIYNPSVTQFLAYGQAHGARTLNGERMFRTQAEASWRIWNQGA